MPKSKYEDLLGKTAAAFTLKTWADENAGGPRHGTRESNLWALVRLAAAALHYFLSHLVKLWIDREDETFSAAEAQQALESIDAEQPASADDLKRAIVAFLATQQLEHDDTGRNDFEPAAKKSREERDVAPAAVSSALHQADRGLSAEVCALWAPRERVAAYEWAEHTAQGGEAPPPEVVSRIYLEDLNLEDDAQLATLLGWVGIPGTSQENWGDSRDAVELWARNAHLHDRGSLLRSAVPEDDEAATELLLKVPAILLPEEDLFAKIKEEAAERTPAATREELVATFRPEDYGASFAIDAMMALGELVDDDGCLIAHGPELEHGPEQLCAAARCIAERRRLMMPTEDPEREVPIEVEKAEVTLTEKEAADQVEALIEDLEEAGEALGDPDAAVTVQGEPDHEAEGADAWDLDQPENPYDPEEETEAFLGWQRGYDVAAGGSES